MIQTSKQLKDKVRNVSKGESNIARTLIRTFMMERFLERVSKSDYRDKFILKGGMLVASMLGVDMRATMDIDTTVRAIPLSENGAKEIVSKICAVSVEDNIIFSINSVTSIMSDFEYPGLRITLEGILDRIRQVIKIDISTNDIITPSAIEYEYKLMFEERTISLLVYNKETLLAEKVQTIIARGIANTRMRDFYDVHSILKRYADEIDKKLFLESFRATCLKRDTKFSKKDMRETLALIEADHEMEQMWIRFRDKNYFVGDLDWSNVLADVLQMIDTNIVDELDDRGVYK